MKAKFSLLLLGLLSVFNSYSQEKNQDKPIDSIQKLNEVLVKSNTMFGSKYVAKNRTGSSYFVSTMELEKFNYTDINRVLRSIPGVTFYEEDGFGLRPNISLRGTSPERSAKISLMEDGVLIAPAPYSAPSAYYFPSVARMQAVEILKGSSQVQYGPFTTGGAINMVSTQIPNKFNGQVESSLGSFNTSQLHATIGDSNSNVGYLVEYLRYSSDGFKNLPNNGNTGFDINEVVAKVRVQTDEDAKLPQALELKFQYSDETSNETYLGLTESDFASSPFSRYSASQKDQMNADHLQFMLTHTFKLNNNLKITTQGYLNNFKRNWYKLDDVVFNGDKQGIASVISSPESFPNHFDIIRGTVNSQEDALKVKANNREYASRGVQSKLNYQFLGDKTFHDIEIGARYHYDDEDRFQWEDGYNIVNGDMNLTTDAIGGSDGNRISSAKAFASYILYKLKYNKLTLTPGLRYENMTLKRENFGNDDPDRDGFDISLRENNVDVFIPGMGFSYKIYSDLSIFGGVHKGFSPPSNQEGQNPEESINYELGSRVGFGRFRGELVGFFNDYSNLLGSDLAATGGTGSLEQFNAGEVNVSGIELLLNYDVLGDDSSIKIPITFGYTLTNTEFQNSFESDNDLWGEVNEGDQMPYIPKHQFNILASLVHPRYELNLSGRYNGEFRTLAGSGPIPPQEVVESNFIIDLTAKYHFKKYVSLSANVVNLFDETYVASRVPAGLRPGHPFGAYAGLEFRF